MRAKISVRVSKFWLTLLRNMRRRRKTRSIPSPIPVVLLLGLIVLLRYLNAFSLSDKILSGSQQASLASSGAEENSVRVPSENVENGVTGEKRREFMDRRHAERRAMHRRIEEQKHEVHESGHEVDEHERKDSKHTVLKENGTKDVSESSRTTSDSTSHSEHEESQVRNDATKTQEHQQQHPESLTERNDARNDTVSEHASTGDDKKSENGGITKVDVKKSSNTTRSKSGEIPHGARVHGKQAEFGGSLGGTTDGMVRGQNVTRVSYTLFKIMKLFGFVSMIDSPAGNHVEWMPEVVERMSFDQPAFQYTGVDNEKGIEKAKSRMQDVVDGDYVISDVETRTANGSDVVFHWTEIDGGSWDARGKGYMEHIRKVLIAAKKGNNGYIVFGQFPRLDGPQPTYRKGKWMFVGEKEEPFLFNEHVRGVVPMGNGRESYMLYMTFYSLRSIPMDQLKA